MKKHKKSFLFAGILTVAGLFVVPSLVQAFTLIGGSLGISTSANGYQRDVRVWNNASDAAANNNTVPDPNYPGALGATMASWKAFKAWSSDTANSALPGGTVNKNFDSDWQGTTSSASADQNVVFWGTGGCGGSTLAFTETPISNGWRITMCESGITWADGPGSIGGSEYDIQSVLTHEYGHALGLGHTSVGCPMFSCPTTTMCPAICNGTTTLRTIEPDDASGLQAIYGAAPANKPKITSLAGSKLTGQTLIINGTNFAATVNVKFTAGTTQNTGSIPGVVFNVPSTAGGTQLSVTIPATAQKGNVLIWEPSINLLSNAFPIDIGAGPPPVPVITSVSPGNVQAFQGGTITLTGSLFTGATQVNSGGTILASPSGFTLVNDNTITYAAPTATALGSTVVTVTNPNGTSNNGNFNYVETIPPKLAAATFAIGGQPFTWNFGGPANDLWFLILSINDNSTFPYPPYNILLNSQIYFSGALSPAGIGSASTTIPTGLAGTVFYSQIVTFDGVADIEASNITTTTIVF